ncbi:MAG: hypothetical protein E6H07_08265 [Bacteroidetes bacterium]|nr:MAG: hypothetical protein E6H07_08265 [Bacteroidota bacterium]
MKQVLILVFLFSSLTLSSFRVPAPFAISKPAIVKGLFDSDDVLEIKLKGKFRDLLNDRSSENPKSFPFSLSYKNEGNSEIQIPVKIKTRGHFRRMKDNCNYPPLLLQFAKDGPKLKSIFSEQKKIKLVMPCVDDKYIIREWLVYKLYNLLSPKSFKARLVKLQVEDEKNKKTTGPFLGILLEEEKQMAKRNRLTDVERKIKPQQTETNSFLKLAVFEYLIGNTDWSVEYLQNIKLIAADSISVPFAVPYDFDHAGIVNAPYAYPAEQLQMSSVRERRYRGYCIHDLKVFEPVLAEFNRLKSDIYKLYSGCTLLDEKYTKSTIRYLDEFYNTINNAKAWQKDFAYPCDKNGTGNVIIKGLKED